MTEINKEENPMRILVAMALVALTASAAQAQEIDWSGDWNKQQYVRAMMEAAKKKPEWNPTKERLEARFDELDTDGDGILTKQERQAGQKKKR